jgi:ferredoxin-NADP reductase
MATRDRARNSAGNTNGQEPHPRCANWSTHLAGQHIDVRLTAEDGYQTERSYSIASPPEDKHLMLTIECIEDGEVSRT